MAGHRGTNQKPKESIYLRRDVEEGRPQQDRKYRFRDIAQLEPDDQRRVEFKKKLLDSANSSRLEDFRTGDEEACLINYHQDWLTE